GIPGNFYTRAGQFTIDNQGYLVNSDNMKVQGYAANPDLTLQAAVTSLKVPTSSLAPRQTQEISITANLDSGALPSTFDINSPANSQAKTSITVFDSLGESRTLDVYFVKTADNAWEYHVLADGAELAGGTPGTFTEVGTGTLTFDTNG